VFLLASGTLTGAILGPVVGRRINHKTLDKFYGPFFVIFIFLMALTMFFKYADQMKMLINLY